MTRQETNIDVVLAQNGITRDNQLAKKLGITPAALSIRLKGDISMDTLEKIAKLLRVSVVDLIEKDD